MFVFFQYQYTDKITCEDRKVQSSAQLLKRSRLLKDTATAIEIAINKLEPDFVEMNNS